MKRNQYFDDGEMIKQAVYQANSVWRYEYD